MRLLNRLLGLVFLLAMGEPALIASAAPLTFQFGGVIDFVEDGLPISDEIAVGAPYSGIYQFDPEGVENSSGLPTSGFYQFGVAGSMTVNIGSSTIAVPELTINVYNHSLVDIYQVFNPSPFVAESILWQAMAIDLRDSTHTAFESTDLPRTAPDIDDFAFSKQFYLRQPEHRFPSITGTVDSLTMIPEPSSLATLFVAATALFLRRPQTPRH